MLRSGILTSGVFLLTAGVALGQPVEPATTATETPAAAETPSEPVPAETTPAEPIAETPTAEPAAELAPAAAPVPAEPEEIPAAPVRLAVTDIVMAAKDLDPVLGESISAVLASELALRGGDAYQVISRNDLRSLLGQQANAQLLGCDEPSCFSDVGQAAAADKLVTGRIASAGEDEWVFTLTLIDVETAVVTSRQAVSWKGPPGGLVELCRPYVARLLTGTEAEGYRGSVRVMSPVAEATVHIDDQTIGDTPVGEVHDLPIGTHRVRLLKDGFFPYERDVVVNRDETTLLQADLVDKSSLEPWYLKWWVWTAAGVVVATAIAVPLLIPGDEAQTKLDVRAGLNNL